MAELYIFDQDDNFLTILSEDTGLVSATVRDELNQVANEPFSFVMESDVDKVKYVKEENRVVFKDRQGDLREYVIKELDDINGFDGPETTALCIPSFLDELSNNIIVDRRLQNVEAQYALDAALEGSRWTGTVDAELGTGDVSFYYLTSVESVRKIQDVWGGDSKDVVHLSADNSRIEERELKLMQRLGTDRNTRLEIDHNIDEIQRTVLSYPATALFGRGASLPVIDEDGEHTGGYTRYITFEDVEWSVEDGDPVDKPLKQKWVGSPDALLKYGYKHKGELLHRRRIYNNHNIEDPEELLRATWDQLQKAPLPEVNYRLSVDLLDENVELGDTVFAIDREFARPIQVQSRIIAIEYDLLDIESTTVVEMGHFLTLQDSRLDDVIDEIDRNRGDWDSGGGPITDDDFPNETPRKPIYFEAEGMFQSIILSWNYHMPSYISHMELYASQQPDFSPSEEHLIWRGRSSAYVHKAESDQVWYYYLRAVNYHGTASDFSDQVSAETVRIMSPDILFGDVLADHLEDNLDLAGKISDGTIEWINEAPMQEIANAHRDAMEKIDELESRVNDRVEEITAGIDENFKRLNEDVADLLDRTSDIDGEITKIYQEIDDQGGRVTQTIERLSNVEGTVSSHSTTIEQHAELIASRVTREEFNTETNELSRHITEVEQKANGFGVRVEELQAELDGLEFENRNLLRNSDFSNDLEHWETSQNNVIESDENGLKVTVQSGNSQVVPRQRISMQVSKDDNLTAQVKVKIDDHSLLEGMTFRFANTFSMHIEKVIDLGNEWKKYIFKHKADQDHDFSGVVGLFDIQDIEFVMNEIKLEKGSQATDWSPAPEDIDAQIVSAVTRITELEITTDGIRQTVSETKSELNELTGEVEHQETRLSEVIQTVDGIDQTVARVTEDLNTTMTEVSNFNQTVEDISLSVARIRSDFNDLEIGGRNLLLDTPSEEVEGRDFSTWNSDTYYITDNVIEELKQGGTYTMSVFYTHTESNNNSRFGLIFQFFTSSGFESQYQSYSSFINSGESGWSITTIELPDKSDNDEIIEARVYIRSDNRVGTSESGKRVRYKWVKFEKGSKATDWSPAPEDTDAQISELRIDVEGISTTVTNVTKDVEQAFSDISLINQKADNISLSISELEGELADMVIGATNLLKGTSSENKTARIPSGANYQFDRISLSDAGLTVSDNVTASITASKGPALHSVYFRLVFLDGSRTLKTEETEISGISSRVTITSEIPSGTTEIALRAYGGQNTTNLTYKELQLERGDKATDWSLHPDEIATEYNVLSFINISKEGIRIHGDRVEITGQTLIEDGVIGTAAIANLAVDKFHLKEGIIENVHIANATIEHTKIKSVNADKITVGTLEGINIRGVNIEGSEVTGGRLIGSTISGASVSAVWIQQTTQFINRNRTVLLDNGEVHLYRHYVRGNSSASRRVMRLNTQETRISFYTDNVAGNSLGSIGEYRNGLGLVFNNSSGTQAGFIGKESSGTSNLAVEAHQGRLTLQALNQVRVIATRLQVGENSIGILPYDDEVRWRFDSRNYIRQLDTGEIQFVMGNTVRHKFNTSGTKTGGTIDIDDEVLGMSPIDSPQVLLETVLFNIELKKDRENIVWLDDRFSKAVTKYSVFPNVDKHIVNIRKEKDQFFVEVDQDCTIDFMIKGPRIGYENTYWMSIEKVS